MSHAGRHRPEGHATEVWLPAAVAAAIENAARSTAEECCGILVGRRLEEEERVVVEEVVATPNTAAGDRRHAFAMDPLAVLAAHAAARHSDAEVVGFYHSHIGAAAVPSRRDAEEAWPDMSYLIQSVGTAGEPHERRSWRLGPEGSLIEERLLPLATDEGQASRRAS
jgi:proteasome lid subunit RPN8/RPN11